MKTFKQFLIEIRYKSLKKPELAFHGSPNNKINKFQIPSKGINNFGDFIGNIETIRHGAFFSDNPKFSKNYGNVYKYNLHIKNPYKFYEYTHLDFANSIDPFGPHRDVWITAKNKKHNWQLFDGKTGEHFVNWLKSKGHDSAKFSEYNEHDDSQSNTTVVFDSNKIKPSHSSKRKFFRTKKITK